MHLRTVSASFLWAIRVSIIVAAGTGLMLPKAQNLTAVASHTLTVLENLNATASSYSLDTVQCVAEKAGT